MSLSVTSNTSTGYEDIDNLNKQQNEISNQMYENQQNIINTQTQQNIADIERNKQKLEEETTKTNKGLYADYQKQVNPYGSVAESLASNGLANSGVAESTRTNLYNTYQKNRTDTLNTAKNLLADYNNEIIKAKQNGDIQLAQFAQEIYNQKMNNLYNNYQLLQNKEQFNYQKERDQVADKKWQDEYDYQKERDQIADTQYQQQFDYNVSRDQVADKKWQDEFDYNKYINDRNYDYNVSRDQIADEQWRQQFDYDKYINDRNYNYQLERDQVADSQWQKEYNLSKTKASKSSGSGSGIVVNDSVNSVSKPRENIITELASQLGALKGQVSEEQYYNVMQNNLANAVVDGRLTQEEANEVMNRL